MTPAMFPWYVTGADQSEMAFWCESQLSEWRTARAAHQVARDQGRSRWAALAVAFTALRTAYRAALTYADAQSASYADHNMTQNQAA